MYFICSTSVYHIVLVEFTVLLWSSLPRLSSLIYYVILVQYDYIAIFFVSSQISFNTPLLHNNVQKHMFNKKFFIITN